MMSSNHLLILETHTFQSIPQCLSYYSNCLLTDFQYVVIHCIKALLSSCTRLLETERDSSQRACGERAQTPQHIHVSRIRSGHCRKLVLCLDFACTIQWELCFLMWMPPCFDAVQSSSLFRNSLQARVNTPSTQSRNPGPSGPYPIPGTKVLSCTCTK